MAASGDLESLWCTPYVVQHCGEKVAAAIPKPQIKINLTENAKSDILALDLVELPAVAVLVSGR